MSLIFTFFSCDMTHDRVGHGNLKSNSHEKRISVIHIIYGPPSFLYLWGITHTSDERTSYVKGFFWSFRLRLSCHRNVFRWFMSFSACPAIIYLCCTLISLRIMCFSYMYCAHLGLRWLHLNVMLIYAWPCQFDLNTGPAARVYICARQSVATDCLDNLDNYRYYISTGCISIECE